MKKLNELSEIATKQFNEVYKLYSSSSKKNEILLSKKRKEILKDKNYGK